MEVDIPSLGGFVEVGGVHYRTDHDLKGHEAVSKKKQEIFYDGRRFIPHVLELSFGVDRTLYAVLENSFRLSKERAVLSLPPGCSPYDVAVFPLVNKEGMDVRAREIFESLRRSFDAAYDDSGSIGKR